MYAMGYVGGNDCRFFTDPGQVDTFMESGCGRSMFSCLVPYDTRASDPSDCAWMCDYPNPMDITGQFQNSRIVPASGPQNHYASADFYSSYWQWKHSMNPDGDMPYFSTYSKWNTVCYQGKGARHSPPACIFILVCFLLIDSKGRERQQWIIRVACSLYRSPGDVQPQHATVRRGDREHRPLGQPGIPRLRPRPPRPAEAPRARAVQHLVRRWHQERHAAGRIGIDYIIYASSAFQMKTVDTHCIENVNLFKVNYNHSIHLLVKKICPEKIITK